MSLEQKFTAIVGGKELVFGTGKLAQQAGGAVTLSFGGCVLFATTTMSKTVRAGLDFFPMSVDYEEKMYAAGRIPGSYFKREGRATTSSILTSRLTDRPLRPLFPYGMRNEVQVIISTMSSDSIEQMDINAINVASAAMTISNIPWNGPVAGVRVGYIDGEYIINPTFEQDAASSLDLRISGTKDAIIMVECRANEVPEEIIVEALEVGHKAMQPIIETILEMQAAVGKEKDEPKFAASDPELVAAVVAKVGNRVEKIVQENPNRDDRGQAMSDLRDEITEGFVTEDPNVQVVFIQSAIGNLLKQAVRDQILNEGIRPDGRGYADLRELSSEVGISPRAHGSGLFQRGETQVLSIASLGTMREAQKLDGLDNVNSVRYMHHYNFPPFSTGETWPLRGPKRREIGHGELARAALLPVLPSEEDFPYAIRVVSEVLSSNGSTSQGSICASTLALMDCGVPIRKPVGGIAMGLIMDEASGKHAILTDIQGMEDHLGDMDFKVAGTDEGITALQMDIKISGLSSELMSRALTQAKEARLAILANMTAAIEKPREELNQYAPSLTTLKVNPEKIGAIIGKGGSTIRSLEEIYEVKIDIQDDGTVYVAAVNREMGDGAVRQIELLTKEVEVGVTYTGKVVRITDFGAFVELIPGQDGLVHISQMSNERIASIEDVVQLGDEIIVMVTAVTPDGKIRLSRRAIIEGWTLEEAIAADNPNKGRSSGGGGNRDRRDGGGGGNRDRRDGGGGGGGNRRR
ncbi:MAG: polyribonucleotide nucleotidyltransferase [Cellvibrionaceae bacterium]|jgi:polyribonucleotide nucleotidyltransferase